MNSLRTFLEIKGVAGLSFVVLVSTARNLFVYIGPQVSSHTYLIGPEIMKSYVDIGWIRIQKLKTKKMLPSVS